MDTELINLLQQTGFTEKEARVYLALLELGGGDVTEIAKAAELKRSIVYVLVDLLIEKGYITQLPNKKINTYQAIDPGAILTQIRTVSKNLSEMLPFLRSLHNKGEKKPKLHFVETKEGILKIYYNLANLKDQFYISSYIRFDRIFPGEIEKWIANYKKNRYTFVGRHLLPNNPEEIKFAKKLLAINQEIHVMPDTKEMALDFSVCGNRVIITSLDENPYLILIESAEMAKSIMSVFEIAWISGKEITL